MRYRCRNGPLRTVTPSSLAQSREYPSDSMMATITRTKKSSVAACGHVTRSLTSLPRAHQKNNDEAIRTIDSTTPVISAGGLV